MLKCGFGCVSSYDVILLLIVPVVGGLFFGVSICYFCRCSLCMRFVFESDFVKHLFVFFLVLKVRRFLSAEIVFYIKLCSYFSTKCCHWAGA